MEIHGKPVKDAKKRFDIHVTKKDCDAGQTKDAAACAAVQAIMREHPEISGARVYRGVTYLEHPKHWERYITPVSLRTELTVFDRGGKFEPGNHTLGPAFRTGQSLENLRNSKKKKKKIDDKRTRHDQNNGKRTRHEIPNIRQYGANR